MEQRQWITRALEGERTAKAHLFEETLQTVYYLCWKLTVSAAQAGELTRRLTHPSGQVLKTYRTTVRCADPAADLAAAVGRLQRPFVLDDVPVCAKSLAVVSRGEDSAVLDITVGEGRNRQIRRM